MPSLAWVALSLLVVAQAPKEPAKDLFLRSASVPGVELRFVDYHWQPAIFEAMASGKGDVPEAKRNWVVARIIIEERPLTLEDKRLPVGNYGLALWPNLDGKGAEPDTEQKAGATIAGEPQANTGTTSMSEPTTGTIEPTSSMMRFLFFCASAMVSSLSKAIIGRSTMRRVACEADTRLDMVCDATWERLSPVTRARA